MSLPITTKDTAHLTWDTKPRRAASPKDIEFQTAEIVIPNPANADQSLISYSSITNTTIDKAKANRLIWGDNLLATQALLAAGYEGKIKLIYIDPPFWTNEDYYANLRLGQGEIRKSPSIIERLAYKDYWGSGIDSYLDMFLPRLHILRRLLSEDGSIFLHCDYHVGHYIKVVMDEIFGRENFRNEIIVKRTTKNLQRQFDTIENLPQGHDVIFWYSKSAATRFRALLVDNPSIELHPEGYWKDFWNNANRPTMRYPLLGIAPDRGQWKWEKSRAERAVANYQRYAKESGNNISLFEFWEKNGRELEFIRKSPTGKVEHWIAPESTKLGDTLWTDISAYPAQKEYPTQKHEDLLSRIIDNYSNKGDLVGDFFCGSGTTMIVAAELERQWIGCDFSKTAIQIARNRLVNSVSIPFLLENIGNYQRHLIYLQQARIYEMQTIVLKLYGANPRNDMPDLGVKRLEDGKIELVYVSYPDRAVTANKAAELAVLADDLDGSGYDRLVILGWDYEYNYDEILEERKKNAKKNWAAQISSKNIPPEVYAYLRQVKSENDFDSLKGRIYFHDKPLLKLQKPKLEKQEEGSLVTVGIDKYVLFDYPIEDPKQKMELLGLVQEKPLSIIDYWAIDWNYDGNTFRSTWQALRRNGNKTEIVPRTASQIIEERGQRQVAVRVVDVFGNDAGSTLNLKI
jgi:adenine-specific DNA-methyltransferase